MKKEERMSIYTTPGNRFNVMNETLRFEVSDKPVENALNVYMKYLHPRSGINLHSIGFLKNSTIFYQCQKHHVD